MRLRLSALILAALCVANAAAAPVCREASGAGIRPLIELYTSEGCDSCPPAERWLSSHLPANGRSTAVALAFHVDYWDRLGWVDRFGSAQYTARQYDAMRANRATFVYTPQVLLQGHDYAGWDGDPTPIDAAAKAAPAATIAIEATPGERAVEVHARAGVLGGARSDAELFIAYADSGLVSDIEAGENRGLRLAHDHVVRAFRTAGRASASGSIDATVELPRPSERGNHPTLVAFVQRPSNGDVLQTVTVALDECGAAAH
jgi:hypothetical protein